MATTENMQKHPMKGSESHLQGGVMKLHIDEVIPKGEGSPMIINFENGDINEEFKTQQAYLFKNTETDRNTIVTEIGDLIYAGTEDEPELGKTLLLARDTITGKVRIIELSSATLKPVIKEDEDDSELDTSNLELSRNFGSKKQKQQVEQREKLKVNTTTVKEQMHNVTVNVTEDKLDISSYKQIDSEEFYIPPRDKTANKAENVYDVDKILTEDEIDQIYTELGDQDYMTDMVPMIKHILDEKKKVSNTQTVLALYASCLLKLNALLMKDIKKKDFLACPYSYTLNNIIITNFFLNKNGQIQRPPQYKDKCLCHAMVFILLINNLKLELDSFCHYTKITMATASQKIRVTGATVVTEGNKKVAQLKLPLNTKIAFRRKSTKF